MERCQHVPGIWASVSPEIHCCLMCCLLVFCQSVEVVSLKHDVEQQKELYMAQELKSKWHLNQLHIETEAHKVHVATVINLFQLV